MELSDEYLDSLIKKKLFKRMPVCMNCGSDFCLDPAHIITRSNHTLRWDILNLVTLCRVCHSYFEDRPKLWDMWWQEHFPDRVVYLTEKQYEIFSGDRKLILSYIKQL